MQPRAMRSTPSAAAAVVVVVTVRACLYINAPRRDEVDTLWHAHRPVTHSHMNCMMRAAKNLAQPPWTPLLHYCTTSTTLGRLGLGVGVVVLIGRQIEDVYI